MIPDPQAAKDQLKVLWISCGDKDRLIHISERTHNYLDQHDIPHIYHIEPGAHDLKVWKSGLYLFSKLLFKSVDPKAKLIF